MVELFLKKKTFLVTAGGSNPVSPFFYWLLPLVILLNLTIISIRYAFLKAKLFYNKDRFVRTKYVALFVNLGM